MSQNRRVYDAIVAGHICLDIIPALSGEVRIEPGHLIQAGPAAISTGGAVSNTGQALAKLGIRTRLIGKVGDDLFGRAIIELLGANGSTMAVTPGEPTSYTVVINLSGKDRTFLHAPGCNDTFASSDVSDVALAETRLLHFGYPTLMAKMFAENGFELVELLRRAKEQGVTTSLDMSLPDANSPAGRVDWGRILTEALPFVDIFAPNVQELQFMLDKRGYEGQEPADVSGLSGRALELGANVVAVKAGAEGLRMVGASSFRDPGRALPLSWQGAQVQQAALPVRVEGTTGAGDATVAGLLAALLRGRTPEDAARIAVGVGACCCERPDATSGLPTMPELEQRLGTEWKSC